MLQVLSARASEQRKSGGASRATFSPFASHFLFFIFLGKLYPSPNRPQRRESDVFRWTRARLDVFPL